jgi:hypothetical protein
MGKLHICSDVGEGQNSIVAFIVAADRRSNSVKSLDFLSHSLCIKEIQKGDIIDKLM